jgi:hypothetical protein
MSKFFSWLSIASAILFLPCLGAGPAAAASQVTFVSGKGTDTGTCADPTHPCRTFQFALGQTAPFGEVKALDPAEYGPMTITQSVSITGVEGASINFASPSDSITINAGPNDAVNLSHLVIDGTMGSGNKVNLNSGGSLTVTHCTVRNFPGGSQAIGIFASPGTVTNVLFEDVTLSNNFVAAGIQVDGPAQGSFYDVTAFNNLGAAISINLVASPAAKAANVRNPGTLRGFVFGIGLMMAIRGTGGVHVAHPSPSMAPAAMAPAAAHLEPVRFFDSDFSQNTDGLFVEPGAPAESAGNNFIRGNDTDISGTLTEVGTD